MIETEGKEAERRDQIGMRGTGIGITAEAGNGIS